jgi:hypothetical protein
VGINQMKNIYPERIKNNARKQNSSLKATIKLSVK